jgi:hypothetical protein
MIFVVILGYKVIVFRSLKNRFINKFNCNSENEYLCFKGL